MLVVCFRDFATNLYLPHGKSPFDVCSSCCVSRGLWARARAFSQNLCKVAFRGQTSVIWIEQVASQRGGSAHSVYQLFCNAVLVE